MSKRIVIALGGNALGNTAAEQLQLVTETAKSIVDLIAAGNEVVVAHGNGPQVGMINLGLSTAAEAKAIKADMPFPECGAMSEGYIGYHLQQAIGNELTAVVNELKSIEDGDEEKGFLGLFKKGGNKIANMKAKYGLDKPFIEQYGTYMRNYMHGDFGISFMKKGITTNDIISAGFPYSLAIGIWASLVILGF